MFSIMLLCKYGAQHLSLSQGQLLYALLNTLRGLDERPLMLVLAEVVTPVEQAPALRLMFRSPPA